MTKGCARLPLLFIISFCLSSAVHSLGLGGALIATPKVLFDDEVEYSQNIGLTFSLDGEPRPVVFFAATNIDFVEEAFDLSFALDFPLFRVGGSALEFYLSLGQDLGFSAYFDGDFSFFVAPRVAFNLSFPRFDGFLEPFLLLAVEPGLNLPLDTSPYFQLNIPLCVGVRIHD